MNPRLAWARIAAAVAATSALAACAGTARPPAMAPLAPEAYGHYLRGRAAFFEGNYQQAVDELEQAQVAAWDQAGIAVALAQALDRVGRADDARIAVARAIRLWPGSPEVWIAAGEIQQRAGELGAALASYRRAIAIDPTLIDAYLGLATAETQAQRPVRAEAAYQALVTARPDATEGYFRLAEIALAREDDTAAEAHLRQVIALDGDRLDARRALAEVLVRAGRRHDAIAELRVAFDRSGYDLGIGQDLVWLLVDIGDRRGAVDVLALYDEGAAPGVTADAAAMWLAIGEPGRAVATAEAAARHGQDPVLVRARALLAVGHAPEATAALGALPPGAAAWPAARALAAEIALATGRPADARAIAEAAHRRAPTHVGVLAALAEVHRRAGDVAAGRAVFVAGARARPRDATLVLAWSGFELRAGEARRALALAEQVLEATPEDPAALNLVGFTLVELGRELPRARRLLARARGLAPGDPGILDSWGWLRRAEGDLEVADRALMRAARLAPHEAEILVHAATVAAARGGRIRARRLLGFARALPTAPELTATIDRALAGLGESPVPTLCYAAADMRTPVLLRLAFGSVLAVSACKQTPSTDQCEQLLAHLIDIQVVGGGAARPPEGLGSAAAKDMKPEVDVQKKAIRDYAVGQKFMESCTQSTPKGVVACGLAAKDEKELAECDVAK